MGNFTTKEFEELLNKMPNTRAKVPSNTIAHIFRHEDKENFISDWLAFLFNPEYTGSMEPLSALLQLASVTNFVDLSDVSIIRESVFEDKRRIDFIIETSTHIIGIENKIWSGLQANQLNDYRKELRKRNTDKKTLVMILLYPQRNTHCNQLQKNELHGFMPVTYEDLVSEFKQIRFNIFDNFRATVLMEDFIVHMEEYIMNGSSDATINWDMWKFEEEHMAKLKALKQEINNSKDQFNNYIVKRMKDIFSEREDRDDWQIRKTMAYFQLFKKDWDKYWVHFELLKKDNEHDEFVPSELKVILHTNERQNVDRTSALWEMGQNTGEKCKISYVSEEEFQKSMDAVFQALQSLVGEYTPKIDSEIGKTEVVPRPKR